MATLIKGYRHKNKPWRARAKRGVTEWFLGYFSTKEEALLVEKEFNEIFPSKKRLTHLEGPIKGFGISD